MRDHYRELLKFAPCPIQITERENLKRLWRLDAYPCQEVFLDFYECFQQARDIRNAFFTFLPIDELHMKGGGLVFAEGHKNTYPIGVELSDLACGDPRVKYQTRENGTWFNESGSLRSFLFNAAAWHILNRMDCTARVRLRKEDAFTSMVGESLFYIAQERTVAMRSNYHTCQNAQKNVLAVYNWLEGFLYFGASDDASLKAFLDQAQIEVKLC